jgi:hypothetical protein
VGGTRLIGISQICTILHLDHAQLLSGGDINLQGRGREPIRKASRSMPPICYNLISLQTAATHDTFWQSGHIYRGTLHPYVHSHFTPIPNQLCCVFHQRDCEEVFFLTVKTSKTRMKIDVIVFLLHKRRNITMQARSLHGITTPERHAVNTLAGVECKAKPPC